MKSALYFGAIGLYIVLSCFASCSNSVEEVKQIAQVDTVNIEEADSVTILYSDSAVILLQLTAPKHITYIGKKSIRDEFPTGVNVTFFNKNGTVKSEMTANYATRDRVGSKIFVKDSVVLINKTENQLLEAEDMTWDERNEKLYTDNYVRITTPDEQIDGYGFKSDAEFKNWTLDTISGYVKTETFNIGE